MPSKPYTYEVNVVDPLNPDNFMTLKYVNGVPTIIESNGTSITTPALSQASANGLTQSVIDVTLTKAQIIDMNANPALIIASPGAGIDDNIIMETLGTGEISQAGDGDWQFRLWYDTFDVATIFGA